MRMPNSEDMSEEQKKIYQLAPLDGSILVTGPPGTGKTVIAFLRADTVNRVNKNCAVIMFGRVLARFTSNIADGKYPVTNFHQWINNWWSKMEIGGAIKSPQNTDKKVYLPSLPFEENYKAKNLMRGKAKNSGYDAYERCWFVWKNIYEEHEDELKVYTKPKRLAPKITSDEDCYDHDWKEILKQIIDNSPAKEKVNWGHLIIDEGQDFNAEMYKSLDMILEIVFKDTEEKNRPAITVFADENQRLFDNNSTIKEIENRLRINEERHFKLTENYRNTIQIARLARTFYTGLQTGIPDLPKRQGNIPVLYIGSEISDSVNYIKQWAFNHDNEEIGVITSSEKDRDKIYKLLSKALDKTKNNEIQDHNISLKSYSSRDKELRNTNELLFDQPGVITVLNTASCKGLEFDTVFLVELQNKSDADSNIDKFKMDMYVMTSRARENLFLMLTNSGENDPNIMKFLPEEKFDEDLKEGEEILLEYRYE